MKISEKNFSYRNKNITQTLFSIANAVNTTDNLDDLYRSIYDSLNELISLPNFFIAIVDKEKKLLSFPFFVDDQDSRETITLGLEKYETSTSNTSRVITEKKPLFLRKDTLQRQLEQDLVIGTPAVIWIGVPLIVRDEVIGVMVVQHYSDPDYFTQNDIDLLIAVSDQVALAIDRKKAQEEIKLKEQLTRTLFSIANAVNTTDNLDNLFQSIYDSLNVLMPLPNFLICLVNEDRTRINFPFYLDEYDSEKTISFSVEYCRTNNYISTDVIKDRKPVFLTQKALDQRRTKGTVLGAVPKVWLGVPLTIQNKVIGAMAVQHYHDPGYFSQRDIDLFMAVSNHVAIAIDRKSAEEKLRLSEKRYRHLFNNAPVPMYEIDFLKARFVSVNKVLLKTLGYTEDEFMSTPPLAFFTNDSKKRFLKDYDYLLKGQQVSNIEYQIFKKDGRKICVIFHYDFIFKQGKLHGAQVVVHDITERKKIEEMMIQSEKMMSVGGLAAGMAHEINNPLAGIMQNVQLISNRLLKNLPVNHQAATDAGITLVELKAYMDQRKIPQLLGNIHKACTNAAAIVDNMLSFARKGKASKSRCRIPTLVDKIIRLAQNDYNLKKKYDFRQIRIVKNFEPSLPAVAGEESKILQVLFNITKNAAESMYEEEPKESAPRIIFRGFTVEQMVQLEIEDNGPGIDDATQKRIFEPFFTTKDVDQGTGLGLSLSYFIIVDDHGGELEVKSAPGTGTTFIIRLPIY